MLDLSQMALIAGGVVAICGGVFVLVQGRRAARTPLSLAGSSPAPAQGWGQLSVPTRLCIGFCAVVMGYHLIVWAFPPRLTNLQVSRSWWWALLLACLVAPVLSFVLDGLERRVFDRVEGDGDSSASGNSKGREDV